MHVSHLCRHGLQPVYGSTQAGVLPSRLGLPPVQHNLGNTDELLGGVYAVLLCDLEADKADQQMWAEEVLQSGLFDIFSPVAVPKEQRNVAICVGPSG